MWFAELVIIEQIVRAERTWFIGLNTGTVVKAEVALQKSWEAEGGYLRTPLHALHTFSLPHEFTVFYFSLMLIVMLFESIVLSKILATKDDDY